jgi:uncharacterized GH25 family protein
VIDGANDLTGRAMFLELGNHLPQQFLRRGLPIAALECAVESENFDSHDHFPKLRNDRSPVLFREMP